MKSYSLWYVTLMVSIFLLTSCKKDDNPITPPPSATHASGTYLGMIAGGSESGVLSLTVPSSGITKPATILTIINKSTTNLAIINLTGTLKIGGVTTTLIGTYNTVNDSLYVSGGGYSFAGTYSNGVLMGAYTGPNGSGGFSTQSSSGSDPVKVYLGRSISEVAGHSNSTLNIVIKGNTLVGMAVGSGDTTPLTGTVSGNTISITVAFGEISAAVATGTFNADRTSASGTYNTSSFDLSDPDHGTWSVSLSQLDAGC